MKRRLLAVLALALLSTGCTDILGRMEGLPLRVGLDQALIKDGIRISAELGWTLAGCLVVLLGLHFWYKAMHGEPWLGLLKEYLGGILIIEARDMEHAVELMSRHPGVRLGGPFEIRPSDEMIDQLWAERQKKFRKA